MKGSRISLILITLLLTLSFINANGNSEEEAKRLKARYYYMEGSVAAAGNNMEEAYEYFKKAYETDPGFTDAAFTYGSQRLFMRSDTLQSEKELMRSLKMLQDYVDRNPADLYAAQMYGYVSNALDTVEETVRVYERSYELMPRETRILPYLADAYMRLMKGKEAVSTLEKYEKVEGKSKDVSLKKITILLAMNDTLAALDEARALIESNPRDPYSRILKGNLYEIVGDMDSVLNAYKEAEALAPENGSVKMSLANYYRAVGDSVMLDNMVYEALLSEEFELDEKLGILGEYLQKLLEESGDKTRGDHLFTVLRTQYPHEPEVLDMAARYAGAKGNMEEAVESVRYAIDMDPTNEQYWLMLLSFDLTQNKYEAAIKDYKESLEHIEPSYRLKNLYAAAASMLDDPLKTEKILYELLSETDQGLNPETSTPESLKEVRARLDYEGLEWVSNLYTMLGDLLYKEGETDRSFKEYENSLYFLADNPLALNNFAYFLSEKGRDLEKAKKMSRRSLDLTDNNPTYLDTYAWILYKLGEYREAWEYMKLALELAGEDADENEDYKIHSEAIKAALGPDAELIDP